MGWSWKTWVVVLAFALGVGVGLRQCSEPRWGPGVVAPEIPIQEHTRRSGWEHGEFSITPLADFTIRARILGVKTYSGSSLESQLSPVDVALGWGNMSDEVVLDQLHITQSGRWYHYRWPQSPPLPVSEIIRSSANMHLVPASPGVEKALGRLRTGDVVVIRGALIEARSRGGWRWRSSTTRTDSGGGACELIWVDEITVEPAPLD